MARPLLGEEMLEAKNRIVLAPIGLELLAIKTWLWVLLLLGNRFEDPHLVGNRLKPPDSGVVPQSALRLLILPGVPVRLSPTPRQPEQQVLL